MGHYIDEYHFGSMTVNGQVFTKDLIILRDSIIHPWWREQGHLLQIGDLKAADLSEFDVLVVGRGAYKVMRLSPEIMKLAADTGIELIVHGTAKAVKVFNDLVNQGKKVVGAFHLTC